MRTFSDNLREIQEKYGISAESIARRAGFKKGTGSRLLSGTTKPKMDTIIRMMEATPISWKWTMYGYEIKKEEE